MKTRVILDVDTGSDDAIALMLAALHPSLDLIGCTTVMGNIPVRSCTENTIAVLDHVGRSDISVFEGRSRQIERSDFPMPRTPDDLASQFHKAKLPVRQSQRGASTIGGVDFLVNTYLGNESAPILIAVAPLSNIAEAVLRQPSFASAVNKLVIMGGGWKHGNMTPFAEFNFWADPEAASIVFGAGFRDILLVPLDATLQALASEQDCLALDHAGTDASIAVAAIIRQRLMSPNNPRKDGTAIHDALAVAAVIDETLVSACPAFVSIETKDPTQVGRSIVRTDLSDGTVPNCRIALNPDRAGFVRLLNETFSQEAAAARSDAKRPDIDRAFR
jgi:inosine-uridine nucleoside N-ribohydrolase